jgi:uncharacterized protein (TIGR03032 family)
VTTPRGVLIDVASEAIVCEGLSMPHSTRLLDGRLWLLNSGAGELGSINPASGVFTALAFCPGYARGLAFAGGQAIVGLSLLRKDGAFSGLALARNLEKNGAQACCGIYVIDLSSGETAE